MSSQSNE
jgi:hypothetical protein